MGEDSENVREVNKYTLEWYITNRLNENETFTECIERVGVTNGC